jgi:hypothetical protein
MVYLHLPAPVIAQPNKGCVARALGVEDDRRPLLLHIQEALMYHSFSVRREHSVMLCRTPQETFNLLSECLREWRQTGPKKNPVGYF